MAERGKGRKRRQSRWLVRRGARDYGPYTTQQILKAIDKREVDLGSLVTRMGSDAWQPAGVHAGFREHYAACESRWREEALDADVAREERKLRAIDRVKGGAGKGLVLGVIVVLGLGGWLVYRLVHAEPTGIMRVVVVPKLPALPAPPTAERAAPTLELAKPVKVKRRREHEHFDTAGVRVEGKERALRGTLDLDAAPGSGLSRAAINRVKSSVRGRLMPCIRAALGRGATLRKVKVTYIVRSGRLGGITLNRRVLKNRRLTACMKRVIKKTKVPSFQGPQRRVRQAFRIQ